MIPCFGVGLDSGFGSVFGSFFGFFFGCFSSSSCFGPFCFKQTANIHITVTVAPKAPAKNEILAQVNVINTADAGFIVGVVECVAGDVGGVIGEVGGDVAGVVGVVADVRVADDDDRVTDGVDRVADGGDPLADGGDPLADGGDPLADGGKVVVLGMVDGDGVGRVLIVVEVVVVEIGLMDADPPSCTSKHSSIES